MLIASLLMLGQSAAGSGAPASVPTTSCRPGAAEAMRLLASADQASARRDARTANAVLDRALQALGTAYRRPAMQDDTDMHLIVARSVERRGGLGRAAMLKRRILAERLALCDIAIR